MIRRLFVLTIILTYLANVQAMDLNKFGSQQSAREKARLEHMRERIATKIADINLMNDIEDIKKQAQADRQDMQQQLKDAETLRQTRLEAMIRNNAPTANYIDFEAHYTGKRNEIIEYSTQVQEAYEKRIKELGEDNKSKS